MTFTALKFFDSNSSAMKMILKESRVLLLIKFPFYLIFMSFPFALLRPLLLRRQQLHPYCSICTLLTGLRK